MRRKIPDVSDCIPRRDRRDSTPSVFRPRRSLALADDAYELDDPSAGEERSEVRNEIVWSTRDPRRTFNVEESSVFYLELDLNDAGETFSSNILDGWTLKTIPVTIIFITAEKFTLKKTSGIRSETCSTNLCHIFFILFLFDEDVISTIFFLLTFLSRGVQNSKQTIERSMIRLVDECDDLPVAEKLAELFDQSMRQFDAAATIGSGENQHRIGCFNIRQSTRNAHLIKSSRLENKLPFLYAMVLQEGKDHVGHVITGCEVFCWWAEHLFRLDLGQNWRGERWGYEGYFFCGIDFSSIEWCQLLQLEDHRKSIIVDFGQLIST